MLMMLVGFQEAGENRPVFACFLQHRPADAHNAGRFSLVSCNIARFSLASCNIARLMLMMLAGFRLLLATSPG